MGRARRHARHDEMELGEFVFLGTGVEYGHDGIKGLRHFVPFSQETWAHDGTANHIQSLNYDATTSRLMNRVTATAGGAISSKTRKRIILPKDFGSFPSSGVSVIVQSSASIPTSVLLTLYKDGAADATLSSVSVKPTVGGVYEVKTASIGGDYSAGDMVTVELQVVTANNAEWAEIGDVEIVYVTGRGNV